MKTISAVLLFAAEFPGAAYAQDSRKASEPSIPPACSTLQAKIGRAGMSIAPEDESKLDTQRIQAEIDGCSAGGAVVLRRTSGRTDAFLSGPLQLRKGVILVVDRGAYLYASRNARDYDRTPGVCGTIRGRKDWPRRLQSQNRRRRR